MAKVICNLKLRKCCQMARIVGVHYEDGRITQVKLDCGNVVGISQAIAMADRKELEGVVVGATRGDVDEQHATLRGVADGNPENNLSNLPRF